MSRQRIEFRYVTGGAVSYPPGATFGPRVMHDYELVWIQRGEVTYEVNGKTHAAKPGSIILARPGFRERYKWDGDTPTRHAYFHWDFLGSIPAHLGKPDDWPLMRTMPEGDIIRPLFGFIVAHTQERGSEPPGDTVGRAVETLLHAYILGPWGRGRSEEAKYPEPVHRALGWVSRRLAEDPGAGITLEQMAEAAAVSGKHLCRLFARSVGVSPMEAVMTLRLAHATQLLSRTDFKLEVIARQCGFATMHHFSRRFKEYYGMPPSEAREEMVAGRWMVGGQFLLAEGLAVGC